MLLEQQNIFTRKTCLVSEEYCLSAHMDVYLVEDGRLFYSLSFESTCGLKYHAIDVNHRARMFDRQPFT